MILHFQLEVLGDEDHNKDEEIYWLRWESSKLVLNNVDKETVKNGFKLNDKLDSNVPFYNLDLIKLDCSKDLVQILHICGGHWIVISNIHTVKTRLYVYDTVYSTVSEETKKMMCALMFIQVYKNR